MEMRKVFPTLDFSPVFIETTGDKDLKTSLRNIGKTDFFTKEIDEMQLAGRFRISIHSAKDIPDPLPQGLILVALTKGVDSADSLVLRKGEVLDKLPFEAVVGTSCVRREKAVRMLRPDLRCVDIRGTVEKRLQKLEDREMDGVVLAEAALIRLQLTSLNRVRLTGETALFQGRLAVIAREGDEEMAALFAEIDAR